MRFDSDQEFYGHPAISAWSFPHSPFSPGVGWLLTNLCQRSLSVTIGQLAVAVTTSVD